MHSRGKAHPGGIEWVCTHAFYVGSVPKDTNHRKQVLAFKALPKYFLGVPEAVPKNREAPAQNRGARGSTVDLMFVYGLSLPGRRKGKDPYVLE